MVGSKLLATFLMGAAAGIAAYKYMNMTPEEREKLFSDLKEKAKKFKEDAEQGAEKAKEYFEELKARGDDAIKEHFGNSDGFFFNLFGSRSSGSNH